jgi:hypothetical protein
MAKKIIDLDPVIPPLSGNELIEMSQDGTSSVKVTLAQASEALFFNGDIKLYADSTGVVVLGDIHCDSIYTVNDSVHIGLGQIKSTAGNIELYDNGNKALGTASDGLSFFNPADNDQEMRVDFDGAGNVTLDNKYNGVFNGSLILRTYTTPTKTKVFLSGNSNSVILYAAGGNTSLETITGGIKLFSAGKEPLSIRYVTEPSNAWALESNDLIESISIQATDGTNVNVAALFDPLGAAALNYSGTPIFETTSSGMKSNLTNFVIKDNSENDVLTIADAGAVTLKSHAGYNIFQTFTSTVAKGTFPGIRFTDPTYGPFFEIYGDGSSNDYQLHFPQTAYIYVGAGEGNGVFASNYSNTTIYASTNVGIQVLNGAQISLSTTSMYFYDTNLRVMQTLSGGVKILNNHATNPGTLYLGDESTDGSWRFTPSGNDLLIEKRVSSSWVTKDTIVGT